MNSSNNTDKHTRPFPISNGVNTSITFVGGAEEVTGSNFLLDTGSAKILIDCGTRENPLHDGVQGPFPYDPVAITALMVTHAHQDHIGRIAELVRRGFHGPIYSTGATRDLAEVMMTDAFGIIRNESDRRGTPLPYEEADIAQALEQWESRDFHEVFALEDLTIEMLDSGHVLGGAMIKISRGGRSILFSGDIGNAPEPLLNNPESPAGVQYLVMESVYGDRKHEGREERKQQLRSMIEATAAKGGTLLIPSFSLQRTQVLLSEINDMVEREGMKSIPIYLDSPLATRVTGIFRLHTDSLNAATRAKIAGGDDIFTFKHLTVVGTTRESATIHQEPGAKVIIAGAGMSNGGRIRGHEQELLGDAKTTLLFVGYQAAGTLGRRLLEGAKKVRIDDEWIRVRAEVTMLSGYSGHADRDQLLEYLESAGEQLERAFIVHGEPRASLFFAQRAKDFLGVDAYVPRRGERVDINL